MLVDDAAELDGLDPGELSAAREAAKARDLDGYLVTLVLPTGHPYLASLTRHDIRDRILTASRSRGSRGGKFDNSRAAARDRPAAGRAGAAARVREPRGGGDRG